MVGKKVTLLMAVCFCLGSLICGATGVRAAGTKIGVLNGAKVLWTSAAGAKVKSMLEKKAKGFKQSLDSENQSIIALQNEIQKKSSVWSKDKTDEKVLELRKMRHDFEGKQQNANAEMKLLREKELKPVIKKIQKGLEKYGKDHGYTVILDMNGGAVPYFDDAIDVTDDLIKTLDKSMSKK